MDAEGYRVRKARAQMLRGAHTPLGLNRIWVAPAKCSLTPPQNQEKHIYIQVQVLLIAKMKFARGSSRVCRFTAVVFTRGAVIETEEEYSYSRSGGQVYPMEKSGFKI